jgi:hypothetical protein
MSRAIAITTGAIVAERPPRSTAKSRRTTAQRSEEAQEGVREPDYNLLWVGHFATTSQLTTLLRVRDPKIDLFSSQKLHWRVARGLPSEEFSELFPGFVAMAGNTEGRFSGGGYWISGRLTSDH